MEVDWHQIEQFLNTGTGVVEDAEEHVIALSVFGQAINLSQQVGQFLLAEIAQQRPKCLLRWNGQDRTARGGQCGFSPGNVSKEGLHRRQPRVAGTDGVATAGLKIREKVQ